MSSSSADQLTKMWNRLLVVEPLDRLSLLEATRLMKSAHIPQALRPVFQAKCHTRFPLSVVFMTEDQKKQNQLLVESLRSHYSSSPMEEQDDEQQQQQEEPNGNHHHHFQDIAVVATEAVQAMRI